MRSSTPKPALASYASTCEEVQRAIRCGCDHIILEHPAVSLRTTGATSNDFTGIPQLVKTAFNQKPTVKLSFNIDIIAHQESLSTIKNVLSYCQNIDQIRLQDPGLASFVRQHAKHVALTLATETGAMTHEAFDFYTSTHGGQFSHFVLSNECPIADITALRQATTAKLAFQVHGPLLIQYSKRRFLSDYRGDASETIATSAYRPEKPKHHYPLLDNHHGHLMYYRADKCLATYVPQLFACQFDQWIIDTRGYSADSASQTLMLYRDCRDAFDASKLSGERYQFPQSRLDALRQAAPRPFIRGFFLKNNTDKSLFFKMKPFEITRTANDTLIVATICDVVRGHHIAVECHMPIRKGDHVTLLCPQNNNRLLTVDRMRTLDGTVIDRAEAGTIITLPWEKGVQSRALLIRKEPISTDK